MLVAGSMALVAALLIASPAHAAEQQPLAWQGTSWNWGSPRPQGEDLAWVDFAGQRGLAGSGSTLMSEDAGATWRPAPRLPAQTELRFVDGARTLVGEGRCVAYRSDDGGNSFRKLPLGSPGPTGCIRVDFPTSRVGYALVGTAIVRSDDAGRSFSPRAPVPGAVGLRFISPDTGFAYSSGAIYRTEDGARTWTPVASVAAGVSDLWFVNESVGYAVGRGSTVLRTADGGRSWSRAPMAGAPARLDLLRIRCSSEDSCLIATNRFDRPPNDSSNPLLRTSDGGTSARPVEGTKGIAAVDFVTDSRVVGVGARGLTVVSDDAGRSFATIGGGASQEYLRLRPVSQSLLYSFGARAIGRSSDAGRTWSPLALPQPMPRTAYLEDASFAGRREGVALQAADDLAGNPDVRVFRTDDAGLGWRPVLQGKLRDISEVLAVPGRRMVVLGRRGLRVFRDGARPQPAPRPARLRRTPLDGFDRVGGRVVVYGPDAFAVSSNLRRWRIRRLPRGIDPEQIDFVSARVGYMVDSAYRLRRTRDRGRTWRVLPATGPYLAFARYAPIAFENARTGFVAATIETWNPETGRGSDDYYDRAVMLRTDDGGRTFRPQFQRGNAFLGDVAAPAGRSSVMALFPGLMWSATGGDGPVRTRLTARARRSSKRRVVEVSGRLRPARGGDAVVVSVRSGSRVRVRRVSVDAAGRFVSRWRLKRDSLVVVQWRGRGDRRGAGTQAMPVRVR